MGFHECSDHSYFAGLHCSFSFWTGPYFSEWIDRMRLQQVHNFLGILFQNLSPCHSVLHDRQNTD